MSVTIALLLTALAAAPPAAELSGRVIDEKGNPLPGATVSLYTAKPRVGIPTTCPSCYRDCAKFTKADSEGRFSIGELDESLLFRVLILSSGKQAQITNLVDPAKTKLEVKLNPLPNESRPNHVIKGRVLDDHGQPLAGAVVSPAGAKTEDRRWWGSTPGVDEAAVTDAEGKFMILSKEPKLGLDLTVNARGFAVFPSTLFELNGQEQEIRMRPGASVSGRLTFEGKPVKNRAIGIVQTDRSGGRMVRESTLATDEQGQFLFPNLQPSDEFALYTLCEAKPDLPALKTVLLKTGADNDVNALGDLALLPGKTVKGRVELPAGAAMPSGAKMRISRTPAWDWAETPLTANGEFSFSGLPPEVYEVSVFARGFVLDTSRLNYQALGDSSFGIRLKSGQGSVPDISLFLKKKTP